MCQKAGKQMSALARLSNVFNQETKMLLMQSFILSHFLYCSVVYHYCSRSDIIKLEKVQKKDLRFMHQDFHSSYTTLREKSNRLLLYVERQRCILQEVYKSIHDLGPRYLHDLFAIKDREYDYQNVLKIELSTYKTVTYGKNTLQFNGANLFNSLGNDFKNGLNYSELKQSSKLGMVKIVYVIIVHIVD